MFALRLTSHDMRKKRKFGNRMKRGQGRVLYSREGYQRYLLSSRWKTFRASIIIARGYACENCGSMKGPIDAHHKTYVRLGNELPDDIVLLCRPCHNAKHEKPRAKPIHAQITWCGVPL